MESCILTVPIKYSPCYGELEQGFEPNATDVLLKNLVDFPFLKHYCVGIKTRVRFMLCTHFTIEIHLCLTGFSF